MNMIFINGHNLIFIKVGNPVEECIEISLRTLIKRLASTIDWNMIINKLNLVSIGFE